MFSFLSEHCVGVGCEWSCPTERNAAALVALPHRGVDALEIETTTGVVAHRLGEGDLHVII